MRRSDPLHILFVASEVAPWTASSGLADAVAALPAALAELQHDVTVVAPRYRGVALPPGVDRAARIRLGAIDQDVVLREARLSERNRLVLVDAPSLYNRHGYYGEAGQDYVDNAQRFALLAACALDYAGAITDRTPVNVVHAHDWQAGLAPVLLRGDASRYPGLRHAGIVFTIHDLSAQGLFAKDIVPTLGLPWAVFSIDRGEFWGRFSFLKGGITDSDVTTTISPGYQRETLRPATGFGLDGLLALRRDRYVGIAHGIDVDAWNPADDRHLPGAYSEAALEGKKACKRALLAHLELPVGDDAIERPLIALMAPFSDDQGLDLIVMAASELVRLDATWFFTGAGDPGHERFLLDLAAKHPTRVAVRIGGTEPLAHLARAGADIALLPFRRDPGGARQMYALRYGAVPVVSTAGGLADRIQPYTVRSKGANGFILRELSRDELLRTLRQVIRLYRDKIRWEPLMRRGMRVDVSWKTAAGEYVRVYRQARAIAAVRTGL